MTKCQEAAESLGLLDERQQAVDILQELLVKAQ
jgi:hypothetical protein